MKVIYNKLRVGYGTEHHFELSNVTVHKMSTPVHVQNC